MMETADLNRSTTKSGPQEALREIRERLAAGQVPPFRLKSGGWYTRARGPQDLDAETVRLAGRRMQLQLRNRRGAGARRGR